MRVLSKAQCQSMPIDEINEINLWWVDQLRQTPQYTRDLLKYTRVDMLKFVKRHCPELEYQFTWCNLQGHERMRLKFKNREMASYDDFSDGVEINDSEYLDYYYPER